MMENGAPFSKWDELEADRMFQAFMHNQQLVKKLAYACARLVSHAQLLDMINTRAIMKGHLTEVDRDKFDGALQAAAGVSRLVDIVLTEAKSLGARVLDGGEPGDEEEGGGSCWECLVDDDDETLGDGMDYETNS